MTGSYFLFSPKAPVLSSSSLPPHPLCRPLHFALAALNLSLSLISLGLCPSVSWYLKPSQSLRRSWDPPRSRLVTKASEDAKDPGVGALHVLLRVPCPLQHAWSVYSNILYPSSGLTTGPGPSPHGDHSPRMLWAQTVILARSPSPPKLPDTRTEPGRAPSRVCTHPSPPAKQPASQGSGGHGPPADLLHTVHLQQSLSYPLLLTFLSPVGPSNWGRRKKEPET